MIQNLAAFLALFAGNPDLRDEARSRIDLDGDTFPASIDCDDRDPSVHPDAEDVAIDGVDQDCDGVNDCEFEVVQADGSVVLMPNEILVTPNLNTPDGASPWLNAETLILDVTTIHPECPDVNLESLTIGFNWRDTANTDWEPRALQLYDLTLSTEEQYLLVDSQESLVEDQTTFVGPFIIPAGTTHSFLVAAVIEESDLNDFWWAWLVEDSIFWSSGDSEVINGINDEIMGGTISSTWPR